MAATPSPAPRIESEVWEVSSTTTTVIWLVIHNLTEGNSSGIYHVEVLQREKGEPAWQFKRLAAHMAITEAALRASMRRPLRSGRVYPEHFDAAFADWQKRQQAGNAPVCSRTVLDCLGQH